MYQAHSFLWLLLPFMGCVLALLKLSFRPANRPRPPTRLVVGVWCAAVLLLVALLGQRAYDHWQFRRELVRLAPAEISRLVLDRPGTRRSVTNAAAISNLFAHLQTLRGTAAHHSSPVDKIEISFACRGAIFRYEVGRDSDRPDEFWIIPVGRMGLGREGFDIGRVHSAQLGPLLNALLTGEPADAPPPAKATLR